MPKTSSSAQQSQIARTLRQEIEAGAYAIGDRLPTEEQLCEMFSATRYSTREALKALSEEGLIVRRTRAGSTVIAKSGRSQLIQRISSIQQILNYAGETERKHLSSDYLIADAELAFRLKCDVGTAWFHLQALRYLKGSTVPLCHTDFYLLPEYAGVIRHRRHTSMMIVDQIAEMFGQVADSTQIDIYADQISSHVSGFVGAKAGSPALNVIRRYCDEEDRAFEITISVHPAPRHTYSFLFKREHDGKKKSRV